MPQHSLTDELASLGRSEDVNSKHPPDKKHCDDSSRDVNDPVTRRFRLAEIEHAAWYQPQPGVGNVPLHLRTGEQRQSAAGSESENSA